MLNDTTIIARISIKNKLLAIAIYLIIKIESTTIITTTTTTTTKKNQKTSSSSRKKVKESEKIKIKPRSQSEDFQQQQPPIFALLSSMFGSEVLVSGQLVG